MKYHVNEKRAIGKRSPMLYGHFIEHFHRQIYDGIYDPDSSSFFTWLVRAPLVIPRLEASSFIFIS